MNRLKTSLKYIIISAITIAFTVKGLLVLDSYLQGERDVTQEGQNNTGATTGVHESIEEFQEPEAEIKIEKKPDYELKESGWIPSWDFNNGLKTLKQNPERFHSVAPVYYSANKDGSLSQRIAGNSELAQISSENNVLLIPSVTIFEAEILHEILTRPENKTNHINSLLYEVRKNDYDGIDLDYESIMLEDKVHFYDFLAQLSTALRKEKKLLSVTVMAKWGDEIKYTSAPQTRAVQDWSTIAKYADEIRIMTYDYTTTGDKNPGPIAPLPWMEKVIKYALQEIPSEKIWIGIHLYSYEWVGKTYIQQPNPNTTQDEEVKTYSYTYSQIKPVLEEKTTKSRYDELTKESIAEYPCLVNQVCTVVYQSPQGVQDRKALAEKYGVAGVTYWRLGQEGELLD